MHKTYSDISLQLSIFFWFGVLDEENYNSSASDITKNYIHVPIGQLQVRLTGLYIRVVKPQQLVSPVSPAKKNID